MYIQLIMICLSTVAIASPVPSNDINPTIANIEHYFGNLAQSLVFRREVNSTEKYQSADGHTQVVIQPAAMATLPEIVFHPTNQHLVAENETKIFSNGTNKVVLAKVELVTEATTENQKSSKSEAKSPVSTTPNSEETTAPKSPSSTTTGQVLKAIPSTVVAGTTESTTLANLSTESISTPNLTTNVAIVTPVSEVVNATSTTTTTAEPESESKEIRDKVKEVEAEPVILTVGV